MKYDVSRFLSNFRNIIQDYYDEDASQASFVITPMYDSEKFETGEDSAFRLIILSEENISGKRISFEDAGDILCSFAPLFPTEIEVRRIAADDLGLFELRCSTRVRKPSAIANITSEYAPFTISNSETASS